MKKIYLLFLMMSFGAFSQNVTITKIIETGCSSSDGFVKTVELYVDGTVDFANDDVVMNYMQNGDPWADRQIDLSDLGEQTDAFVYLVRDIPAMQAEFPSTTFNATNTIVVSTSTNGDDGYQVVLNGEVVSQFGRTETDADNDSESNWNHNDTVAIRLSDKPDIGVWDPSQWEIRPENDLDDHTSCQNEGSTNLETYFSSLGGNYPLGSGSGWTPTGDVCKTVLGSSTVSCESSTVGDSNDTYTATLDFDVANTGNTFTVTSTAGTVGGDNPTTTESGTITITNIPEGTDITVSVSDAGDGGDCDLSSEIQSPGCVPLVLNETLYDPPTDDETGDVNNDGVREAQGDEFIEFINNSEQSLDISGYTIFDTNNLTSDTPRHEVPDNTVIPANGVYLVFGGGTPTGSFGDAIVDVATSGRLNLNNSGDEIIVKNTSGQVVIAFNSADYDLDFGNDQSITRSPDVTGDYVLHTTANSDLIYSPGLSVDGNTLSINEDTFLNEFKIYPNPVRNGFVNIESDLGGEKNVEIFDLMGRNILSTTLENQRLELSNLNSGVYLIRVSQANTGFTQKLIIN